MKNRVLTALALAPLILAACVVKNPFPLFAICLIVTTLAFWELRTLLRQPKALPVVTLFSLAVPFFGTEIQSNRDPIQIILYASLFWAVGLAFAFFGVRSQKTSVAGVDMAGLWISMPMTCLLMLHKLMPLHPLRVTDQCFLLLVLLPLWAGDIAAYLFGKKFGKHRLAPAISPNKSLEGCIANLVACLAVSVGLIPIIGDYSRLVLHIVCGVTIGVVGQVGDLFESWIKRVTGVKDSGTILPGHGGVLDRIDSLLFTVPAVCLELVIAFH